MIVQDEISLTKVKNGVDGGDGKDGTNGKDGENGKDSNTYTAYSWSADGSDRFTTVYPNENLLLKTNQIVNPYRGSTIKTTENVPVQDWNATDGTLIEAVAINHNIFGTMSAGTGIYVKDSPYVNSVYIKNTGNVDIQVTNNMGALVTVEALQGKRVIIKSRGNGSSDVQFNFQVTKIDDRNKDVKFIWWHQKIEISNTESIYTPSPQDDFNNAWPIYSGTYSSHEKVQSQNPKDYTWARIRGADGLDGKDGQTPKDVISGYLSNEAIIVPATPTGAVTDYSKAFGDFIVSEGQTKLVNGVTYSKVSEVNMTSTINSAGRYVVTALSADTGTATYRATYAGVTVDKVLIVVKNKQGPSGAKGDKGDTGAQGDPTGITVSSTVPTNKYINMLWQNTGSNNGYLTGTVYQWNGAKWNIFIFSAENIVANSLSAISAYLGNVQGGTIAGSEFINKGEFHNPAIDKLCLFETVINGHISTNYSEKNGSGKGVFYLSPYQLGGGYSKKGNLEKTDTSWSFGDSGLWLEQGSQTAGDWSYVLVARDRIAMFEERFNNGTGDFNLKISDIAKYPPTQLDPASGYSIYSVSGENLPTAKRSGRAVTLSGAFKNNSNVSTEDTEILLGRLPKWAVPKDVERTVCQGSGVNRFLLTVRPNGNIYWSRYGKSTYETAGAGAWLNINIRYDGVDL